MVDGHTDATTTQRDRGTRTRNTTARVRSDPTGQTRWVNSDSSVARDGTAAGAYGLRWGRVDLNIDSQSDTRALNPLKGLTVRREASDRVVDEFAECVPRAIVQVTKNREHADARSDVYGLRQRLSSFGATFPFHRPRGAHGVHHPACRGFVKAPRRPDAASRGFGFDETLG
jgi:hypothetical protein